MKKLILFIGLLVGLSGISEAQVALSTKDSITTNQLTDIMLWQTYSGGSFLNRQQSYRLFRNNLFDYMDGAGWTWAAIQTFNGATFASGAHGSVTFGDSTIVPSTSALYVGRYYPYNSTSFIGTSGSPIYSIYTRILNVMNSGGTDSMQIVLNDNGELSIPKLEITESVDFDSSGFNSLALNPHSVAISDVKDTLIAIDSTLSYMVLALPGNVDEGINTLTMTGVPVGHIVIITHFDATDSVIFEDVDDSWGNGLNLAGNFYAYRGDNIALMYIYDQAALSYYWIELWRKDN